MIILTLDVRLYSTHIYLGMICIVHTSANDPLVGLTTQLSRVVPPQFDAYGYTFWIPSQVEPTVALIGTSLPAMSQALMKVSAPFKKFMATVTSSRGARSSEGVSTMGSNYENLEAGKRHQPKGDSESEVGLRENAYELTSIDSPPRGTR